MFALNKFVLEEKECAQVRDELSKYITEHGVFGNLNATKYQDRLSSIKWWNMYDCSTTYIHKLIVRVLSQVVNTSFEKRCWSNYSFIHSIKRNNLNVDRAKSLVYAHYNLNLLSHYCNAVENDNYKKYVTWNNNLEETNLEDANIVLECLENELLGDHDSDHTNGANIPPPSTSSFQIQLFCLYLYNIQHYVGGMQLLVVFHEHFHLLLLLFFIDHRQRN
jgi:hypothetical protein